MKHLLKQLTVLAAMIVVGVTTASAQLTFELNESYTPADMVFTGTVVLPTSGDLYMTGGNSDFSLDGKQPEFVGYGGDHGAIWRWIDVDKGEHTIKCTFFFGETFKLYMPSTQGVKVDEFIPAEGETVTTSVNYTGEVVIRMNQPVTYESAYLTAAGMQSQPISGITVAHNMLAIPMRDMLTELYNAGALNKKGGTQFTLVLTDVHNDAGDIFGTDGTMTVSYIAGVKMLSIISTNIADMTDFKSYYTANSPEGIITFTFDQDIPTGAEQTLVIAAGNPESVETYYYEQLVGTVDGATVTFDLTGVNRRNEFLAKGLGTGTIVLMQYIPMGPKGLIAEGDGSQGSSGSYSFNATYLEIDEMPVSYEFTPATGASLADDEQINIWYDNTRAIESFSGVLFAYEDGTTDLIPAAELQNVATEPGEAEYNVTIPARAKTEPVTVSLADIVSADGYSKSISAQYNKFVVTYSFPLSDGATFELIEKDPWWADNTGTVEKQFMVRTNYAEAYPELYIWTYIIDATTGEYILDPKPMDRQEDGSYRCAGFVVDQTLLSGHAYQWVFKAWADEAAAQGLNEGAMLGKSVINFFGKGKGFEYSITEFDSIDPEPYSTITATDNTFVVTYTGLVMINAERSGIMLGMGAGLVPFDSIEAVNDDPDNMGYDYQWRITVSPSLIYGTGISLAIAAFDNEGRTVAGDMMTYDDTDYKSIDYIVHSDNDFVALATSPTDGEYVNAITQIRILPIEGVGTDGAAGINWNCDQDIIIYNRLRQPVYTVNHNLSSEGGDLTIDGTTVLIDLAEPITEEGAYHVVVPEAYFTYGDQFSVAYNRDVEFTIFVGVRSDVPLMIEPTNGDAIDTLTAVYIYTDAAINAVDEMENVYITLTRTAWEWNAEQWDVFSASWGNTHIEPLTEDGATYGYKLNFENAEAYSDGDTYTLTVPEGFFVKDGKYNAEYIVSFTVGTVVEPIRLTFVPADGATIERLTEIVVYTDAELNPACAESAYLTDQAGMENFTNLETWTTTAGIEPIEGGFRFVLTNSDEYTAEGRYYFGVPYDFFIRDGKTSDPVYLEFTIGDTNGEADPTEMIITITPDAAAAPATFDYIEISCPAGLNPTFTDDSIILEETDTERTLAEMGGSLFTDWFGTYPETPFVDKTTFRIVNPDGAFDLNAHAYRLTIPAGFFRSNDGSTTNDEVVVIYAKLEGIATILGDIHGEIRVFDAMGRLLMQTADASALRTLRPGLYIINGRKYLLR